MTETESKLFRLLVLATHPVQYRAPLYRRLAEEPWLDLEVWYGDDYGVRASNSSAWGVRDFKWDTDLVSGYRSRFLRNRALRPHPSRRFGIVNPSLGRELARARPDGVWISGYAKFHDMHSLLAAWRRRIPVLYTSDSNVIAQPPGWRRRVKRAVVSRIYQRIDAFLVTGSTNDRHYREYGVPEAKRFFFPWAVENQRFAAEADRARSQRSTLRERWRVCSSRDIALFVGRMAPEKDPVTLVAAAALDDRLHVVTAGSGPLEAEVRKYADRMIPGRYTGLGFVNQAELPSIYACADLLVLPSRFEPWGLVVNEALASGCPVVASEQAGAAHDLVPEPMRFRAGDPEDLIRAVQAWRDDVAGNADAVVQARTRVESFSFVQDVRGLHAACASVAG